MTILGRKWLRSFALAFVVCVFSAHSASAVLMVEFSFDPATQDVAPGTSSVMVDVIATQIDDTDAGGGINLGFEPFGIVTDVKWVSWGDKVSALDSIMLEKDAFGLGGPFSLGAGAPQDPGSGLGTFGPGEDFIIATLMLTLDDTAGAGESGGVGLVDVSNLLGFPAAENTGGKIDTNVDGVVDNFTVQHIVNVVPEPAAWALIAPLLAVLARRRSS